MQITKRELKLIVLLLSPVLAVFFSLFIGTYSIPPDSIFSIFWSKLTGSQSAIPAIYERVIFEIRLPRILLGLLGGMALSVSGASLQSLFRNPLVDSYILGVSAGAGLGAAFAIAYLPNLVGMAQLLAFLFGFGAFLMTYYAARTRGETPVLSLVLGGIIVTALLSAGQTIVKFMTSPEQLAGIVYWLMGSLASANWHDALVILPFVIISFAIILLMRTSDNRIVIPVSGALGALTLILADDIARSLMSFELPVGILTTLIGAPFFLYLLKRRGSQ